MAAAIIEEEAQRKVRSAPLSRSGERRGVCVARVSASPLSAWCARSGWAQHKGKGKGQGRWWRSGWRAVRQSGGGGETSTSRGESSRPRTLPSASAGLRGTVEDAVQAVLPSAEAASGTQQPAGGGKKEKERQRKERQRQRRMDEAWDRGAAGSDRGDGGSEVREPSVFLLAGTSCLLESKSSARLAGRTHVWRCVCAAGRARCACWRRRRRRLRSTGIAASGCRRWWWRRGRYSSRLRPSRRRRQRRQRRGRRRRLQSGSSWKSSWQPHHAEDALMAQQVQAQLGVPPPERRASTSWTSAAPLSSCTPARFAHPPQAGGHIAARTQHKRSMLAGWLGPGTSPGRSRTCHVRQVSDNRRQLPHNTSQLHNSSTN
jgi:hypothetical protein